MRLKSVPSSIRSLARLNAKETAKSVGVKSIKIAISELAGVASNARE